MDAVNLSLSVSLSAYPCDLQWNHPSKWFWAEVTDLTAYLALEVQQAVALANNACSGIR